jgi:phage tail-like protein
MARSAQYDPLDKFRWRVYVLAPAGVNFIRGGFTECSAPSVTFMTKEYMEGGRHMNPILIHDRGSFKPITLKRGVIANPNVGDFARWMERAFEAISDPQTDNQYRRDIVIEHLNRNSDVAKRYIMRNCVPITYEPASDFGAGDDSGFSIETLSFQYEGFEEEALDTKHAFKFTDILKAF